MYSQCVQSSVEICMDNLSNDKLSTALCKARYLKSFYTVPNSESVCQGSARVKKAYRNIQKGTSVAKIYALKE